MAITWTSTRSSITDQGLFDMSVMGSPGDTVANPTTKSVPGIGSLTMQFSMAHGTDFKVEQETGVGLGPWRGNFTDGELVLWTVAAVPFATNNGPITLTLNADVAAIGCNMQADAFGSFLARITVYDSADVSLGTHDFNGNSNNGNDGSALFVGAISATNNIRKMVISQPTGGINEDFAINAPIMYQVTPGTGTLIFSKTTSVEAGDTDFIYTVGPGLDPAVFAIRDGAHVTYTDLTPGTYTCEEGTLCGWHQTGTTVSNGTIGAIVVTANTTTTADIQNAPSPVIPGQGGCGNLFTERRLIRRVRIAPHETNLGQWIFINNVQLDIQTGVGITSGVVVGNQGVDPLIHLEVSRDGGMTWGPIHTVSAGKLGEYRKRANFWRLGHARDLVFRVTVSDPVAWSIIDAYMDIEPGLS